MKRKIYIGMVVLVFVMATAFPAVNGYDGWHYPSDFEVDGGPGGPEEPGGGINFTSIQPNYISAYAYPDLHDNAIQIFSSSGGNITDWVCCDLTGDSIKDVLMRVQTNHTPDIIAVNGRDGRRLWDWSFYPSVQAKPAGDLNGDNKIDVIIGGSFFPTIIPTSIDNYGAIIAINGQDGTALWGKDIEAKNEMVLVDFILAANLTSASSSDIIMNIVRVNKTESITSKITVLNGSNGNELWTKSFDAFVAVMFPADLIPNNDRNEVVIHIVNKNFTSSIIALNGANGAELWKKQFLSDDYSADFTADLTGDGAIDPVIQIGCCELQALRGYDGKELWTIDACKLPNNSNSKTD